jgi:hypothetical protein
VRFKNGAAYRLGTRDGQKGRLVKLNSADFDSQMKRGVDFSLKGWAPFAMGEEGDLYMTRHFIDENDSGNDLHEKIYHSNYTGGGPLVAAGTLLVVDGLILGIRGDSGHYKPTDHNIAEALRVLATRGVKVHHWDTANPRPPTGAMAFIASQRQDFLRQIGSKKQAAQQRGHAPVAPAQIQVQSMAAVHLAPVQPAEIYSNVTG